jgi:hypothetical protein
MNDSLKLNENAPVFSYTREELFNTIMCIVAHPHKHLTEHDKARAMAIFVTFADYLGNYTEGQEDMGHWIAECEETDFEGYVLGLLKMPPNFNRVDVNELLK